jgi:hypothetical protein
MSLKKQGSPTRIKVVKNAGFTLSENFIAEMISKQMPVKKLTIDQLHNSLKSIGVVNYSADDLNILIGRLQAIGFTISK